MTDRGKCHVRPGLLLTAAMVGAMLSVGSASAAVAGGACSGWVVVPSPSPGTGANDLRGIAALSASDAWAVGFWDDAGLAQAIVEHWNGSDWAEVPSPHPFELTRLFAVAAVAADDVWAVGDFYDDTGSGILIEHWDGVSWRIVPTRADGQLDAIAAVAPDDVWAVGSHYDGSYDQPIALHWYGARWRSSRPPSTSIFGALAGVGALASGDVWASGDPNLTDHWDGKTWSVIDGPGGPDSITFLNAVAAISTGDVWAIGNDESRSFIRHWDGSTFTAVRSRNPGTKFNTLSGAAAVSSTDVWAVGTWSNHIGGQQHALIEHWDGSVWSLVDAPNAGGGRSFDVLRSASALPNGEVWAAGQYRAGGLWRTLIERCPA